MIAISVGCPASVGPEVAVAAASEASRGLRVLCGSSLAIARAAELLGIARERLQPYRSQKRGGDRIYWLDEGPPLAERDLAPERPTTRAAGRSQLAGIETAYRLCKSTPRAALVTGPVNKSAIARSAPSSALFRGHTEWLQKLDGAKSAVMCFAAPQLVTSLASTHLPIAEVPGFLSPRGVAEATVQLARFLPALGKPEPRIAVCSLNPHAGESELLGDEERRAIAPGVRLARRRLAGSARVSGPVGAESAYRLAVAGEYDGVVAMYHDQATIPTKLLAFGDAVNVTLGLSIVRTSVDHGTAYDIAWQKRASSRGMCAALELAQRISRKRPPRRG